MRRAFRIIAAFAFLIGLWSHAHAQIPMTGAGKGAPGGGGFTPSCSQSSTFLTAATGVTLTADKTNYDTLICGLVTDSELSKLDVLYIWAAPSPTNASLINLANPGTFNGTTNGTVSFSAYHGYTGDASTFYIDSGFNPNTATTPQYVQDSASVGIYVLSNFTSGGASYATLDTSQTATTRLVPYFFGNATWTVNDGSPNSTTSSTSQGQWIATRTASTALALYLNGNTTAISSPTTASVAVPNTNFFYFASNSSGTPGNFSSAQMSAAFIGSKLTATDQNKIAARINTYMTAYGVNVY